MVLDKWCRYCGGPIEDWRKQPYCIGCEHRKNLFGDALATAWLMSRDIGPRWESVIGLWRRRHADFRLLEARARMELEVAAGAELEYELGLPRRRLCRQALIRGIIGQPSWRCLPKLLYRLERWHAWLVGDRNIRTPGAMASEGAVLGGHAHWWITRTEQRIDRRTSEGRYVSRYVFRCSTMQTSLRRITGGPAVQELLDEITRRLSDRSGRRWLMWKEPPRLLGHEYGRRENHEPSDA